MNQCTVVRFGSWFQPNAQMGNSSASLVSDLSSPNTIASLLSVRRRECRCWSCPVGTAGGGRVGGGDCVDDSVENRWIGSVGVNGDVALVDGDGRLSSVYPRLVRGDTLEFSVFCSAASEAAVPCDEVDVCCCCCC